MGDSKVISRAQGRVVRIVEQTESLTRLTVEVAGKDYPAINFDVLTGGVKVGDAVLLNTTAVELNLGTGGSHFVIANLTEPANTEKQVAGAGHIMKIRYTPIQMKVLAVEEPDSPFHELMTNCVSLEGAPAVCCSLHSMLPPAAAAVKAYNEKFRVVYVMTDGAALPLGLSRMVQALKRENLIDGCVTVGHAFGGEVEAVNIYSGLLAARAVLKADVTVVAMGPGIVGTGTPYGFSGIEQAGIIHAVHSLGGVPIAVPRLGFADSRERHRGLSHHSRTVLAKAALVPAQISMPLIEKDKFELIICQMREAGIISRHRLILEDGWPGLKLLKERSVKVTTMGRSTVEEPEFFLAASCAGRIAAKILSGENLKVWEESDQ
jgi:hypothetical protein